MLNRPGGPGPWLELQLAQLLLLHLPPAAKKVLDWPKICKLAHAFLREYSYKRLKLAQLLGQLGGFLTLDPSAARRYWTVNQCEGRQA